MVKEVLMTRETMQIIEKAHERNVNPITTVHSNKGEFLSEIMYLH